MELRQDLPHTLTLGWGQLDALFFHGGLFVFLPVWFSYKDTPLALIRQMNFDGLIGIKLSGSDKESSIWHHEKNRDHDDKKELLAMSVTQVMEQYQSILEGEIHAIAYETGAVKR